MGNLLAGKAAVVTGGGRGIGRAISLGLAQQGAHLVVCDIGADPDGRGVTQEAADLVVNEIKKAGGKAIPNYDSVVGYAAAEKLINTCVNEYGKIDILVNVAGNRRRDAIYLSTEDDYETVVGVNLKGTFNCTRWACARMKEQKSGRVINISSDYWRGVAMNLTYSAAKAGVVGLTRSAALDMKPFEVTVNAVCPFARTRWYDNLPMERVEALYKAGLMEKWMHDELHDPGGPEHIPPVVIYLASDKASHITGKVFGASKGRVAIFSEPIQEKGIYKDGVWTPEELIDLIPKTLYSGV